MVAWDELLESEDAASTPGQLEQRRRAHTAEADYNDVESAAVHHAPAFMHSTLGYCLYWCIIGAAEQIKEELVARSIRRNRHVHDASRSTSNSPTASAGA